METMFDVTGIDGSNILAFDGVGFAKATARESVKIWKEAGFELAVEYLKSMSGLTVKMGNCTATYDNTTIRE